MAVTLTLTECNNAQESEGLRMIDYQGLHQLGLFIVFLQTPGMGAAPLAHCSYKTVARGGSADPIGPARRREEHDLKRQCWFVH